MLIVVRCVSCGKTLADQYDYYMDEVRRLMNAASTIAAANVAGPSTAVAEKPKKSKGKSKTASASDGGAPTVAPTAAAADPTYLRHFEKLRTGPIMDKLGLTRYCCRRHMLGTVDMMDTI